MNESGLVNFFVLLRNNKKTIGIITVIVVVLTMVYFIFCYGTYTSSCMLSLKFNEHFLADSSTVSYVTTYEKPQFKDGMLDSEALAYIESIKPEKTGSRINPYNENMLNMNEYYMDYIFEQKFYDFVSENGIDVDSFVIENINDDISIRTHSKKKGESYEIMQKLQQLIPQYVKMKYDEMLTRTKESHEAWMENDKQKLSELIESYNSSVSGDTMAVLEERRRILNEYACVADDYDISYSVVRTSEDLLKADFSPAAFIRAEKSDSGNKTILIFTYLFVALVFAISISVIYIYLKNFIAQVKSATNQVQ